MNYIIDNTNSFMHFFHSNKEGLCFKTKESGKWSESFNLCSEAENCFCVFCDENSIIHILCTNKNNDILYIIKKNNEWSKFTLSQASKKIIPIEFKIAPSRNFLNFFYSAHFDGSIILVHCILGTNAKPAIIDKLSSDYPQFNINENKIYYTNSENILGFKDFSDGKPEIFNEIAKEAFMPYSKTISDTQYLVYVRKNLIFLNGRELFSDMLAKNPVISKSNNKLTVEWESGGFIRYITSFNNGATWSASMRFINNNNKNDLFCIQTKNSSHLLYGYNAKPEPVIYGNTNMFFCDVKKENKKNNYYLPSPSEYSELCKKLSLKEKEIDMLKKRLKAYGCEDFDKIIDN